MPEPRINFAQSLGEIKSVAQYLKVVDDLWVKWSKEKNYIADIWFRGHGDMEWTLTPSAMRPPYSTINEHRFRHDFMLRAQPFLQEATQPPKDDWDWYFLMQHYGIPTRLLDWTVSALVALYFAIEDRPSVDGCVWILNPRQINISLTRTEMDFIPIYSDESVAGYLPKLWDDAIEHLAQGVIAIDPPLNSHRLAAQRGKFTVHGRDAKPLETYEELAPALVIVEVPQSSKGRIARQLLSAGIAHSILFPGLEGLGTEIRDLYGKKHDL